MPTSADKALHGKRYTNEQKDEILRFVFTHGNSRSKLEEELKKRFGAENTPNCSTIDRWIRHMPEARLETLKPLEYQDEKHKEKTEKRIGRGKKPEDLSAISMKSFYLCFHYAYSERNKDCRYENTNKRFACSNYLAFLKYLFEGFGTKVRYKQLRTQLSQRPYSQRVQDIFGPDKRLYDSICQQIRNIITIDDTNEEKKTEDLRRQAILSNQLKIYISEAIELFKAEQKRMQSRIQSLKEEIKLQPVIEESTLQAVTDKKKLQAEIKKGRGQLQAAIEEKKKTQSSIEELEFLHSSINFYEDTKQATFLISAAIGMLIFLVYGEGVLFSDIRLKREVIEMVNRMCIPHDYISDFLSVTMTTGISGRMGRHQLLQLTTQPTDINPLAAFELGETFYKSREYDKAYKYYEYAAERGHAVGAWSCGYMLVNNRGSEACSKFSSKEERFKRAYEYFELGQSMGSPAAIHAIGQLYMRGQIVNDRMEFEKPDYEKAIEYFEIAISKNYFYSYNALAWVYEKMAESSEDEIAKSRLYQKAYHQYEQASVYSDGYSRNKMGIYWEEGFIKDPASEEKAACKEKAAFFYLHALNVLEEDIEPWSYYNAGRVFCGEVTSVPELRDDKLGIHECLPDVEKAKTYLKKACAFMEQQCEARQPKAYITANDQFLLKYLDCVLLLTQQNITRLDMNYYDLLSIVQKALDSAERWFDYFNTGITLKNGRDIYAKIRNKHKWIAKYARQITDTVKNMSGAAHDAEP